MKENIKKKVQKAKIKAVLDAVTLYFDEVGYSKPTMNDIAKVLGISIGALYKLFPSKEELFYAYIAHQIDQFYNKLVRAVEGKEPKDALKIYVQMKFEAFKSKRRAMEDPVIGDPLFFVKLNTKKENPAKPIFNFLATQFKSIEDTPKEMESLKVAYLFNSFTMGYIEYWLNFGGDLENDAGTVLKIFLNGIKYDKLSNNFT